MSGRLKAVGLASALVWRSAWAGAAIGALVASAGCGKDDRAPLGASPLISAPDPVGPAPDLTLAARDPGVLAAALSRPYRASAAAWGAHRLRASSSTRVREDQTEVEKLEVEESLVHGERGGLHIVHKNSKDYGREIFFIPGGTALPVDAAVDGGVAAVAGPEGLMWLRPGAGKFHRRAPAEPDEPARLADETFASLGAAYDLVAPGAQVADGGPSDFAGRAAKKLTLSLGPARPRPEPLPQRAWRSDVSVQALAGELYLDEATGGLLKGHLEATLTFVQKGRRYTMELRADHEVSFDEVARAPIVPPGPADSVDTPGRSTDEADRAELLGGLAAPRPTGKPPAASPRPRATTSDRPAPSSAKSPPAPAQTPPTPGPAQPPRPAAPTTTP